MYELRLSHHIPPAAPPALAIQEWAERVEEATGGRVKFTIYPSESLAKGGQVLWATQRGICDVAMLNLAYAGQQLSLNSVFTLGSLAVPSESGTEIWDRLLGRFPEMEAELSGVRVLGKSVSTSTAIHVRDKELHVPDDVSDMKIAAMGDRLSAVQAAGATPVNMSPAGWKAAARKGVIVGCMAPIYVVTDRGMEAVFDSHLDLGLGQGGEIVVMNCVVWSRLPADIRAVIDGLTPWLSEALRTSSLRVEAEGWQKCAGQTVTRPTSEELKLWMACFEPATQQWIRENADKGPSQEIYDYLRQLIEEYQSES
ncbi:MAG: TRAP transporter substrate-binding protein DctP [Actinomycetia bacterium]|nr:TRAP transporter substrate-binding protein DctP [Actinomycetes bacterium]